MNRKKVAVLFNLFILFVFFLLLLASYKGDVVFSHDSGVFEDSFELSLKSSLGLGKVYYTLDGNDPRENGLEYQAPIKIDSSEYQDPKHRFDRNSSGLEILGQQTYYTSRVMNFPIAIVVRATCKDIFGRWGDVKTETYVLGKKECTVPIVSVLVDEGELFDENGIYINGNNYDVAAAKYEVDDQLSDSELLSRAVPVWEIANWADEERTVRCYVQEFNGDDQIDGWGNLKISGAYSRIYPQKSFNVSFDEGISYALDDGEYNIETHGIKLRNGGSGGTSRFLNDYIIQNLSSGLYCDNVRKKNVELFINGEYWGIYQLSENLSREQFCKKYEDIESEDVINIIKGGRLEKGNKGQYKAYSELCDKINTAEVIDDELWLEICRQIDLDSFIDCYLLNMFFGNTDYINHNTYVWNYYNSLDGDWSKWRCSLYDLDETFTNHNITEIIALYSETDPLFSKLITREEFRKKIVGRAESIIETNLSQVRVDAFFDSIKNEMGDEVPDYYKRFGPDELAALSDNQAKKLFFEYLDNCHEYIDFRREFFVDILGEMLGVSVHDLNANDYLIDFREIPNQDYVNNMGIYLGEGEAVWAQNGAEIIVFIKSDGAIAIDFSKCEFREGTKISFNDKIIWDYSEGVDKLRKVIVPKEYIYQESSNIIRFWTSYDIDYSNDMDPRQMCFRLSDILFSQNRIFDDDESFSITFADSGNGDQYCVSDLFYEAESDGRWGQDGVCIDFLFKGDNDIAFDVSQVYANDMQLLFNGELVWDSQKDIDTLAVVEKSMIYKEDWNRLTFRTSGEILSPKELGISEDSRLLAFYFKILYVKVLDE